MRRGMGWDKLSWEPEEMGEIGEMVVNVYVCGL